MSVLIKQNVAIFNNVCYIKNEENFTKSFMQKAGGLMMIQI